jgi:hypothetical protein
MRLTARVIARPLRPKVGHYIGAPPELTDGKDVRHRLPPPVALLIEESEDGVFLFRIGSGGEPAGDTWHPSIEEAKEQALFEYGAGLGNWSEIPLAVPDVVHHCIGAIR